jgi:hypothetical protein
MVLVLDDGLTQHPGIVAFCKNLGIGLKVYKSGLGIETHVRTDVDPPISKAPLIEADGWFPRKILDRSSELKSVSFKDSIIAFVEKARQVANDKNATFQLVCATIESLMHQCSAFRGNIEHFMRLQHFESLLHLASPDASDHVFHSFRVFLAGCPIVDTFYDALRAAHDHYRTGNMASISVEYTWLLASVFHDVGKPKEGGARFLEQELGDEDIEVSVVGKDSRWGRQEVQSARNSLASLAAYVAASAHAESGWDGGVVCDARGKELGQAWMQLYDGMRSHAVIGAIDFLAQVFKVASAAAERRNRPFVVTHAVPAALAVLLHDWKIWEQAKDWGLFPVDASMMPMAAILIYLDTWDDYMRHGSTPSISIRDYTINARGAKVVVEWADSERYEAEKIKYRAFESALKNLPFGLKISHGMAGDA